MRFFFWRRSYLQLIAAAVLVILAVLVWFFAWRRGLINADELAGYRLVISDYKEAMRAGDETSYDVRVRIGDGFAADQYLLVTNVSGETWRNIISQPSPGEIQHFRFPVKISSPDQTVIAQARLYLGGEENLNNLLLQQSDINGIIK